MISDDDEVRLLTMLLDRRIEHLALEAPELLDTAAVLAEQGYIFCGGGRPIRDENGRVRDVVNAELTAQGRRCLEEKRRKHPFQYWTFRNPGMIRVILSLIGLVIIAILAVLSRDR